MQLCAMALTMNEIPYLFTINDALATHTQPQGEYSIHVIKFCKTAYQPCEPWKQSIHAQADTTYKGLEDEN